MTTFKLEKGSKFQIEKGLAQVQVQLGWGKGADLDGSVFGLVHLPNGNPKFYGEGSHAICYANPDAKQPDETLASPDGAIKHSGDARDGSDDFHVPSEIIDIDFDKMPKEIVEVAVWITLYHAKKLNQTFGNVQQGAYLKIVDPASPGVPLAQYDLGHEFASSTAIQVGSFMKDKAIGIWEFAALGVGSVVELDKVLQQYM